MRTVSYISDAYGGSTSDRQIVDRSSLKRDCDTGNSIMADKGFDVQDIFAPYDVTVNIPIGSNSTWLDSTRLDSTRSTLSSQSSKSRLAPVELDVSSQSSQSSPCILAVSS